MTLPAVVIDPGDLKKTAVAYAVAATWGGDEYDIAALAGLDITIVRKVMEHYPDVLDATLRKFEMEGKAAEVIARKAQAELVRRIADVASSADPLEAIDLIKPITRILENADRVRLAERETDKYANLPVIHFTIGAGGAITTTVEAAPGIEAVDAVVVDAGGARAGASLVPEIDEQAATEAALALAFDAAPLPVGGDTV